MNDQTKNHGTMRRAKSLSEELMKYYIMMGALAAFVMIILITNP